MQPFKSVQLVSRIELAAYDGWKFSENPTSTERNAQQNMFLSSFL